MIGRALKSLRSALGSREDAQARELRSVSHSLAAQIQQTARAVQDLSARLEESQRETRAMIHALTFPPASLWKGKPEPKEGEPPSAVFTRSVGCRQEMFEQPYFSYWTKNLGHVLRYHRKLWEFVFICQVLSERGVLRPGARGLGFGVGEEPLSAFFASKGCQILATDLAPEAAAGTGWAETQQHAANLDALRMPLICPDETFDANVRFEPCDMNAIPETLKDFNFCWSACALEHLGSIENGLAFIEASVDTLRPGGWAVHTTEFNMLSDDATIDNASTVLFRKRDFLELAERLKAKGHIVAPFDFDPGEGPIDRYIDVAPYRPEPHLTMALQGFATTSFGIIVRRGF